MGKKKVVLITGATGFIGLTFLKYISKLKTYSFLARVVSELYPQILNISFSGRFSHNNSSYFDLYLGSFSFTTDSIDDSELFSFEFISSSLITFSLESSSSGCLQRYSSSG